MVRVRVLQQEGKISADVWYREHLPSKGSTRPSFCSIYSELVPRRGFIKFTVIGGEFGEEGQRAEALGYKFRNEHGAWWSSPGEASPASECPIPLETLDALCCDRPWSGAGRKESAISHCRVSVHSSSVTQSCPSLRHTVSLRSLDAL